MLHIVLAVAAAPLLLAADASLDAGTQLSYRGAVEAQAADVATGPKTFDLSLWILDKSDAGSELFWLVDERGNGEFPWPAKFGRVALDPRYRTAASGPALLYDRGEGRSVVPVLLPFLTVASPLAAGAEFEDGPLGFHVDKSTKLADRAAWHVSVRDQFGPKRTLVVDQAGPLVLGMKERVFMGRGEVYELSLELVDSQQLSGEQLDAVSKAARALSAVRDKLNLPERSQEITWKAEQAAVLEKELPELVAAAAGTPLAKLATAARRDFDLQAGRHDAVAALVAKYDGHTVDDFDVRGTAGERLRAADLQGQVTVLHFWDYRDEPLHEPYGQVGYLDFLYHRRGGEGLRLYGVAVNPRLAEPATRAAAQRSAKKLKSFMNLSYPVLLDSGDLLRQFGDPRVVGASLPLFVVIGRDGKIIHYHVGTYEVHQDQGLKDLDALVAQALEAK